MKTWKQGVVGKVSFKDGSVVFVKCLKYPLAVFFRNYSIESKELDMKLFYAYLDQSVLMYIERIDELKLNTSDRKISLSFRVDFKSKPIGIVKEHTSCLIEIAGKEKLLKIADIEKFFVQSVNEMQKIKNYSISFDDELIGICETLIIVIDTVLSNSSCKLYHGAPVWFINDNPIVGYSKKGEKVALLFWSGQSFNEGGLSKIGKFKAAEVCYTSKNDIDKEKLEKWLKESKNVVWNYKDLQKNNGILNKI